MKTRSGLCALLLLLPMTAWGSNGDQAKVDPDATRLLKQMATMLKAAQQITFRIETSSDELTDDNRAVQLSHTMDVALRRDDRLLAISRGDDGHKEFRFDGRMAVIYYADYDYYASTLARENVDGTLDFMADEYGFVIPVSDFLASEPYDQLMDGVTVGTYEGQSEIRGIMCHHLAFGQEDLDWQVWIEEGPRKRPRKFVMTFKTAEGWPQYTAFFFDWDYAAQLPDALFTFDPPPGTRKIDFHKPE